MVREYMPKPILVALRRPLLSAPPQPMHKLYSLLPTTLAALLLAACTAEPPEPEPLTIPRGPRPVILLDIDTLRADHLGCYGYPRDTSPNIDALCEESAMFEWAFAPAPNTLPSQSTLFTSLHPFQHGAFEQKDRLPQEVTTLAEVLLEAGYTTQGFADGGFMGRSFGMDQGFQNLDSARGGLERSGDLIHQWVRDHAEEDFLLLVHTYDVHAPYDPPEPYDTMFLEGLEPPTPGFEPNVKALQRIRLSQYSEERIYLPPNDLAFTIARYDGGIRYVDDWIGGFLDLLKELGIYDRALIVFFSDHGDEFQEHGSVGHEKLYSTITRIPLMFRFPGGLGAGRIDDIAAAVDLAPTIIDTLGLPVPEVMQGKSLLPLVEGRAEPRGTRLAYGESLYFGRRRFIAYEDHRLLHTESNDSVELYRFREDPHELQDVSVEDPEWAERLRTALTGLRQHVEHEALNVRESNELSPEMEAQLEALGYIQ